MKKVDLITGFLGAGKTTYIKKYIRTLHEQGIKFAVIENEFGAAGVDTAILKEDFTEVKELTGGCICCALKVGFHDTILELLKTYDRVIIEPSGIFAIQNFFDIMNSSELKKVCQMGEIVCIIDAAEFPYMNNDDRKMIIDQAYFSDKVIFSKTDGYSDVKLEELYREVNLLKSEYRYDESDANVNHAMLYNATVIYPKIPYTNKELEEICKELSTGKYGEILRVKGYADCYENNSFLVNCTATCYSIESHSKNLAIINIIGRKINRVGLKELFSLKYNIT